MKKCMNNMMCLQPRLAKKFAKKRSKYKPFDLYNPQDLYGEEEDEDEMNSIGKEAFLIIHSFINRLSSKKTFA